MVDIIKRGDRMQDRSIQIECNACDSVLRYRLIEGSIKADARDGTAIVFKCPVCFNEIWIAHAEALTRAKAT